MSRKLFALALGALIVGVWGGPAWAGDLAVVEACGPGGCGHDHGCCREGVCVPIMKTKQVEKRCYTDTCEQFCLPRCGGLFGGHCGGCDHGGCDHGACDHVACDKQEACHQCGHVCVKKYLIVKIKQQEECVPACKVEHQACAAPCGEPAGTIQPAPAKPMPAKPMPSAKPAAATQPPQQVQVLEYRFMPMPSK
jgi:hypothetical protein